MVRGNWQWDKNNEGCMVLSFLSGIMLHIYCVISLLIANVLSFFSIGWVVLYVERMLGRQNSTNKVAELVKSCSYISTAFKIFVSITGLSIISFSWFLVKHIHVWKMYTSFEIEQVIQKPVSGIILPSSHHYIAVIASSILAATISSAPGMQ